MTTELRKAQQLTAAHALPYAPGAPMRRRKRNRRIVAALALVGLCILGIRYGQRVFNTATFLYQQYQCRTYVAPAGQVVFEAEPQRAATLGSDSNYVVSGGCAYRKLPAPCVTLQSRLALPPTSGPNALLFMHARALNGRERLVIVERIEGAQASARFIPGYDILVRVIEPATLFSPAHEVLSASGFDVMDRATPASGLRFEAGQVDPSDSSRFTIVYYFNGTKHTATGTLTDERVTGSPIAFDPG